MSRVPRWKLEKTKVKVVFRLQFHATHVPQQGWDKLFISFVSLDTGKVAAKTNKANVKNGNCKWADPIYETTRLLQDSRTKKYDEKLYKIVVSMGTSRSNILGEGCINLADYADALKPSSATLPLEGCEYGTILHVMVQLLTSKTGFREFEQQRELGERVHLLANEPADKVLTSSGTPIFQSDKVGNRVKLKSDLTMRHSLQGVAESNEDIEDATAGLDCSSYTSESINTEKSDTTGTPDATSITSKISGSTMLHWRQEKLNNHILAEGRHDVMHSWSSDYDIESNLTTAYEGTSVRYGSMNLQKSSMSEIWVEVSCLQKLADELSLEIKDALRQLSTDFASGESLVKEVSILKSECIKIRADMEELKRAKKTSSSTCELTDRSVEDTFPILDKKRDSPLWEVQNSEYLYDQMPITSKPERCVASVIESVDARIDDGNGDHPLHALKMKWLQGLYSAETKVREIYKKAEFGYGGSDFDILSDLVDLEAVLLNLKTSGLEEVIALNISQDSNLQKFSAFSSEHNLKESNYMMEERVTELLTELERSKVEQENLLKKMGQMEHYYETLIQDREDIHKNTSDELDILKSEHLRCCYTISVFQTQIEKMHQDMNDEFSRFAEDRRKFDELKQELEKQAYASESMLKRIRWNYSVAVERLQKDLELLSNQVLSLFEANENLAREALAEVSQLLFDDSSEEDSGTVSPGMNTECLLASGSRRTVSSKYQSENAEMHMAKNYCTSDWNSEKAYLHIPVKDVVQAKHNAKLNADVLWGISITDSSRPLCLVVNEYTEAGSRSTNETHTFEELKRSFLDLQESYLKTETELSDTLIANLNSEVSLNVLQEVLSEKIGRIKIMAKEIDELSQNLSNSIISNQMLERKLQYMVEDANALRYYKTRQITECKDLTLRNHILEAKLQEISQENSLLSNKVVECQILIRDLNDMDMKYKACNEEKLTLENMSKIEKENRICIEKDLSSIVKINDALRRENSEYRSLVNDLQEAVNFANEKLGNLCSNFCYCDHLINKSSVANQSPEKNLVDKILTLEQLQEEVNKVIFELRHQKKEAEDERDLTYNSLQSTVLQSQELVTKLNQRNSYNNNLQLELHHLSENLKNSSEAEKLQTEENKELASKLAELELELQRTLVENSQFAEKLCELERINEELERTQSCFISCIHEKETLMFSVQSKMNRNVQLENELCSLKERLASAHNEIARVRDFEEKINDNIKDLTVGLIEKQMHVDGQKLEVDNLKLQILELDAEKSELQRVMSNSEEWKEKLEGEKASLCVQLSELETDVLRLKECIRSLEFDLMTDKCYKERLETQVANITNQLDEKDQMLVYFEDQKAELSRLQEKLVEMDAGRSKVILSLSESEEVKKKYENENVLLCSQIAELETSISYANRCLEEAHGEIHSERSQREKFYAVVENLESELLQKDEQIQRGKDSQQKLEDTIGDLTCILNKKNMQIDEHKVEIVNIRQQISDLELINRDLNLHLAKFEELLKKVEADNSALYDQISDLETKLHKLNDLFEKTNLDLMSESMCRENLEIKVSELTLDANEKLRHFENQNAELLLLNQRLLDLESEKAKLQYDLSKNQAYTDNLYRDTAVLHSQLMELESGYHTMNHNLSISQCELHVEKVFRQNLEGLVTDLQADLVEKERQILMLREQRQELDDIQFHIANSEAENSEFQSHFLKGKECQNKSIVQKSLLQLADLESQNKEMLEFVISADLEATFIRTQFSRITKVLTDQFNALDASYKDLQLKYLHEKSAQQYLVPCKSECIKKNGRLSSVSLDLKCENDVVASARLEHESSDNNISVVPCEVAGSVTEWDRTEGRCFSDDLIKKLKGMINFEEEIDKLKADRYEVDISFTVLKLKLDEQREYMLLLKKYDGELEKIRQQQQELTYRLSEQILKTEEFKNLSIHLKELKDKSDAEYLHVQGKKETEGPSIAIQETLRMAFIKEQCETKVQEMKNQLSASKKYGEELLMKLQNAVDELEFRKKSEVSHLKRNEDLSAKLIELDGELKKIISDRNELQDVCDRMKAELECCSINLECSKDEKLRLEASLRECNEERTKNRVELDLVRRRLEILSSSVEIFEREHEPGGPTATSFRQLLDGNKVGLSLVLQQSQTERNISIVKDNSNKADSHALEGKEGTMEEIDYNLNGNDDGVFQHKSESTEETYNSNIYDKNVGLEHIEHIEEKTREGGILQNWAMIQKELERLKKESLDSFAPLDEFYVDPDLHGLHQELPQLDKENDHLGIIPLFKEFSCTGNAMEKVLVLDVELAEALEKKTKDINFRRQADGEEAIFKSFKDINELTREMLELKGRYAAVESELKEMQVRYSQLSLQFAEVEGERQKLMMTLKNRTPRRQ